MKIIMYIKYAVYIFTVLLPILSCSYGSRVVRGKLEADKIENVENCKTFDYEIVTNKNGQQGVLSINGLVFSQIFIFVQDNKSAYFFAYDLKKSSVFGYNRVKKKIIKISDQNITKEELSRGWYLGSNRKEGTPVCWIFAQWNGGSAFINPVDINEIISKEPFNAIFPLNIKNRNLY